MITKIIRTFSKYEEAHNWATHFETQTNQFFIISIKEFKDGTTQVEAIDNGSAKLETIG